MAVAKSDRATLTDGATTVSLVFQFNAEGAIATFRVNESTIKRIGRLAETIGAIVEYRECFLYLCSSLCLS